VRAGPLALDAPRSARPARPGGGRAARAAVLGAVGLLGAALALAHLGAHNALYGVLEYDDGVNFGASLRLTSGLLPYRDFVFLQPPGIALLLSPFAGLAHLVGTREALAWARVATALVGGLNAFLAAFLVRHRGLVAAATAGTVLAVLPTAYFALRTVMLEPYCALFCLLGANLAFSSGAPASPRRLAAGGLAFGVAVAVKLFALAPIALACLVLATRGPRRLLPFAAGTLAGAGALVLPFALLAPHAFAHDVVTSQLLRHATRRRSPVRDRLWGLTGLRGLSSAFSPNSTSLLPDVVGAAELAALGAGSLAPALARRADAAECFALASGLAVVGAIFVPPEYYAHYVYFAWAFLAPAAGCAAARAVRLAGALARSRRARRAGAAAGAVAAAALLAGVGLVAAATAGFVAAATARTGDPGPLLMDAIPPGACVLTDAAILTITADRFLAARPGCPAVVDSTGDWLALDPRHPPQSGGVPAAALVGQWRSWLERADYVLLESPASFRVPWTPALRAELRARFEPVPAPLALYARRSPLRPARGG